MDGLVEFVAEELSRRADPEAAPAMAAYLKTDMPFYGVKTPERRGILKEVAARFPIEDREGYERAVVALWQQPHREEKYLAIGVARSHRDFITMESVPLYRRLVVEGAWWDLVDGVAVDLVGEVLRRERTAMSPVLDEWIDDPDLWLRRTAIISQLKHKTETDVPRLFRYCVARAEEKEFFIRKAIGWALREYAKTDPEAVGDFVLAHREVWSGLTFREATKHLELPDR